MNREKIKQIVSQAFDRDVDQRDAFVRKACGDDQLLLAEVLSLLNAASNASDAGFLPSKGDDADQTVSAPIGEKPGSAIGRYKLLQQIGEGGFGVVYMAEQEVPVKRRVALKVIKAGMDTHAVIARFEAERQALAMMDHPNIARVLDAGATNTGRPYFVMELVKGIPITDYCDQANLDMRQRLELFMDVCRAVQHAHQKGIIHRDLKPSNIMVTLHDAKPVVKVIDFGIAKATDQKLTEKTLFTNYGQMIGTPVYMSPEQAVLSGLDVDTRSDVYSLGVLLYELLAGSPPFDAQTLRSAGFEEMRRIIREEQPSKPSTKLSTLEPDLKLSVAARRQVNPQVLSRQLKGDLDWIVLKAIEKDRGRRYESASAFAQDIQRHLNSEPVTAGAPGTMYRLRKFLRRNRGPVAAAVLIVTLLLTGTAISTWQAVRATRAEKAARLAQLDAERQKNRAAIGEKLAGDRLVQVEAEKKNAQEQTQVAKAVKDFLQNKLLAQTDTEAQADALVQAGQSSAGAKLNPTIGELLDRAANELAPDKIEESFPNQPLVQAEILETIGATYSGIGDYQPAVDCLSRAVAIRKKLLGINDSSTLMSMSELATAYKDAGELDLALPLLEETFKLRKSNLGPDDRQTLFSMDKLASAYKDAGKIDLALPLLEETLKMMKAKLGPKDPYTLNGMNNLALAYKDVGKLDLAIPLYEQTVGLKKTTLGPEHPDTLKSILNLASAYLAANKTDMALPLLEQALTVDKAKLGPEHPITLKTMDNLASAYRATGRLDLALRLYQDTVNLEKAKLGPEHPVTLASMENLAFTYYKAGNFQMAMPRFEEILNIRKAKFGLDNPKTLNTMNSLAAVYLATGKLDMAVPLYEQTLKLMRDKLGNEDASTLNTMNNLAATYEVTNQFDRAELLNRELLPFVKQKSGGGSPAYASKLAALGLNLLHQEKWTDAEPYLRECLAIRIKAQPDVWSTFNTQSLLGASLLGQRKYTDAEPLLLAGYAGMKQREKAIPPQGKIRVAEALDRLIELYTATNKPDEVKKWQAERVKYPTSAPAK